MFPRLELEDTRKFLFLVCDSHMTQLAYLLRHCDFIGSLWGRKKGPALDLT